MIACFENRNRRWLRLLSQTSFWAMKSRRIQSFFNYIANIVFEIWMVNKFFVMTEKYLLFNVNFALNFDW